MVERESRFCRRGVGAKAGGLLAAAALVAGLAGCNPVETYRNWSGVSENDPNPKTTPNTKNLAAGEARSYPNLATVPAPPSQTLTMAELDKLTKSLIADRQNAKYTSERLQATFDEAAAPPPPPPPPPTPPAGTKPATVALGAPGAPPVPTTAPAPPPAPSAPAASVAALGGGGKAAARKPGQPPEPGPMESSLQSPQLGGALPQPEAGRPAPPPPRELSMPAAGSGAHLPAPPAPAALPGAIGSAKFQPAPPPPNLPPPEPVRTATAAATAKPPKAVAPSIVFAPVADIAFSGDQTALGEADRARLGKLAERYRQKPGAVRVVGYAGIGSGAAQQLDSYRIALGRAQTVAAALAKAGIPAGKIAVQAAPSAAGDQGRAEILFAQ